MKVAILSDVHGNMVGLEAAWIDLERECPDAVLALGDMIQGGPQPAEVAGFLRRTEIPVVMGNADAWLLSGIDSAREQIAGSRLTKLHAIRKWSLSRLCEMDRAFIRTFTPTVRLDLPGGRTFLGCHGSPTDFEQMIFPHTPEAEFQKLLGACAGMIVAGGHVHLQFVRRLANGLFFNPGSVGVAYNHEQSEESFRMDPWAEYAVLSVDGERIALEFRRVPYDVDRLAQVYRDSGRPFAGEAIAQYLPA